MVFRGLAVGIGAVDICCTGATPPLRVHLDHRGLSPGV